MSLVAEKYHPYIRGEVDGSAFLYIAGMEAVPPMVEQLAEALQWAGADDEAMARFKRFFIAHQATVWETASARSERREVRHGILRRIRRLGA